MSLEMISADMIIYIVLGLWILVLTVLLVLQRRFLRKLTKDFTEKELKKILVKLLDRQKNNTKKVDSLNKALEAYKEDGKKHVQKHSLVRFNPFQEIGGDHSFSVTILDGNDDGFVITGLHTRERTRIYSKPIGRGKSKLKLSKEEQQSLDKALK